MHTVHQPDDNFPPPLPEDWDPGALPRPDWAAVDAWEARLGLLPWSRS